MSSSCECDRLRVVRFKADNDDRNFKRSKRDCPECGSEGEIMRVRGSGHISLISRECPQCDETWSYQS